MGVGYEQGKEQGRERGEGKERIEGRGRKGENRRERKEGVV